MKQAVARFALLALSLGTFLVASSQAQIKLLAIGELDGSRAGANADLSGLKYTLENLATLAVLRVRIPVLELWN